MEEFGFFIPALIFDTGVSIFSMLFDSSLKKATDSGFELDIGRIGADDILRLSKDDLKSFRICLAKGTLALTISTLIVALIFKVFFPYSLISMLFCILIEVILVISIYIPFYRELRNIARV